MVTRLQRLEAVQKLVLEISKISARSSDIVEFIRAVHLALTPVMYAANFYAALFDQASHTIRYVYEVDERDAPLDPQQSFPLGSPEESPTAWVILNRQPLAMTAEEDAIREREAKAWGSGSRAEHWVGYPLLDQHRRPLGALVIQSYDQQHMYSEEDQALFGLIAAHISVAMQSMMSLDRLEQAVSERTAMLEREIDERRKAEALQRSLYQIAELSVLVPDKDKNFTRLQEIISELMDVPNFMIALFDESKNEFTIEYIVDEKDSSQPGTRFPLGMGITSYVIQTRQAQLLNRASLEALVASGAIRIAGTISSTSWMGAPLLVQDRLYGILIIQSYSPALIYTQSDLELIAFVANHVATLFARRRADENIRLSQIQLEQQNDTLNQTLATLKAAQSELVRQEKLASLGSLIAGIAHEINTPLGICVTATSHMVEELALMQKQFDASQLTKTAMAEFIDIFRQSLRIMTTNSQRSASLISSFKQVAVDQSSENIRHFDLRAYLDEVLLSLQPKLKNKKFTVQIVCPPGIVMKTYPGAISQILTNLITNSLLHGFDGREQGNMLIQAQVDGDMLLFNYSDDGLGVGAAALERLFEPFYTTKRGQGGSGLGTHIVYNLVTGSLDGSIKVNSQPGAGLHYQLKFPRHKTIKNNAPLSPDTAH